MSELLPCPICGGKSELEVYGATGYSYIKCQKCGLETIGYYDDETAVEAWNTRAERTCKFVSSRGSDYPPVCSACGYELGIYDCEWFEDGSYGYGGNYCQNCGAKVMTDEH